MIYGFFEIDAFPLGIFSIRSFSLFNFRVNGHSHVLSRSFCCLGNLSPVFSPLSVFLYFLKIMQNVSSVYFYLFILFILKKNRLIFNQHKCALNLFFLGLQTPWSKRMTWPSIFPTSGFTWLSCSAPCWGRGVSLWESSLGTEILTYESGTRYLKRYKWENSHCWCPCFSKCSHCHNMPLWSIFLWQIDDLGPLGHMFHSRLLPFLLPYIFKTNVFLFLETF